MTHQNLKAFFLLLLVIGFTEAFLQFNMVRTPGKGTQKTNNVQCITTEIDQLLTKNQNKQRSEDQEDEDVDEEENYKEICYEKDISYSIELYNQDSLKLVSMDLTTPISWVKGTDCNIEGSAKKCKNIMENLKQKVKDAERKIAKHLSKHKKNTKKLAMIEGSSELVKGIEEKSKNLIFRTRDTGRLARFTEIIMMGLWMRGEKDMLQIQATTFINATQLSDNLNSLCDGAISLRFDEKSENSFLKEVFDYVKTSQKIITIYMSPSEDKNILTIGDLTTKNTDLGYGGINWMKIEDDDAYGKLPTMSDIILDDEETQSYSEENELEMPSVLTMSASYLGFPSKIIDFMIQKFPKEMNCQINNETRYLQCKKIKGDALDKIITLQFDKVKVSFKLQELVLEKSHKKVTLNIKKTFHDNYAVLGEPIFQKYFVALDYTKNKIGFGPLRQTAFTDTYKMMKFVRYLSIIALIAGVIFILFISPLKNALINLKDKGKNLLAKGQEETEFTRPYSPVQDSPYDELGERISSSLADNEAEGI